MQYTSRRVLLFAAGVVALAIVVVAMSPWGLAASYRVRYLRERAVELAEALDAGSSIRLAGNWYSERVAVQVEASKPREEPLRIHVVYTRLVAPAPRPLREVVRGRPDRSFERLRKTAVYFNSTHIVVDPKPLVEYVKTLEYGRTVHVVKITILRVTGQLVPGATLYRNSSSRTVYERTYDYPGVATIRVGGQEALNFRVRRDDALRLVVVEEEWVATP